jgi:hypothetical protein
MRDLVSGITWCTGTAPCLSDPNSFTSLLSSSPCDPSWCHSIVNPNALTTRAPIPLRTCHSSNLHLLAHGAASFGLISSFDSLSYILGIVEIKLLSLLSGGFISSPNTTLAKCLVSNVSDLSASWSLNVNGEIKDTANALHLLSRLVL